MARSVIVPLADIPASTVIYGLASKEAEALPGDRILRAFINAAEAMQIAVAAGLFAGRADGGLAVAVVSREAR